MHTFRLCQSVFLTAAVFSTTEIVAGDFSAEKVGFTLTMNELSSSYNVTSLFVLPNETVNLEVPEAADSLNLIGEAGTITRVGVVSWQWSAPAQKGIYPAVLQRPETMETMTINLIVMVPYSEIQGEELNGYRIGRYPTIPLKQLPIYKPPRGFIEVTRENEETLLSPHFRLKQFLCKQAGTYPKYIVLRERLLLKLELILQRVNDKGYAARSFNVMSGYRTPFYNKSIGNVKYSRHIYGGAADIFIDEEPPFGMMDDLNRDGKYDYRDAEVLRNIVEEMVGRKWYETFIGGLAHYRRTTSHGPFVHVDVRGFHARW